MDAHETALWWARIRAAGPQLVDAGGPRPPGLLRLPEPGGSQVWLTTILPNGAGPAVLDELDLPRPVLEQPNDTARVLASVLKSCWLDPSGPLWPGATAPFGQVVGTFEALTGHDEVVSHRAVVAALRRLSWSGWLLWDEQTRMVRLGPRVATWAPAELSTLRELWRSIPAPAKSADPGAAVTHGDAASDVTDVTDVTGGVADVDGLANVDKVAGVGGVADMDGVMGADGVSGVDEVAGVGGVMGASGALGVDKVVDVDGLADVDEVAGVDGVADVDGASGADGVSGVDEVAGRGDDVSETDGGTA